MADLPSRPSEVLGVHVYGPDVTHAAAVEIGKQMVDLIDAVAEAKGLPTGLISCSKAEIACDSCDTRRAWDDEGHGWVRTADGHDYCIDCIVSEPRKAS